MAIVTGDQYLESLVKFIENQASKLIEGTLILKLNPVGLRYVQSRLEALAELETLLSGAPVDYLRAYVSDLGDHRALEQLRRILTLIPSLKLVSVLAPPVRDPTPLFLLPFGRLKVLELRGCDLSTSAAKGLLELRFTLEKLICHNSTDALRHVFVSRIAEIKDSPQWNRLSFVSCACNGLVLMDEALQLLPVVETLDLSRNKFAKVDNLRKCIKLKHLDLGFNSLRNIASFTQVVSCQIVKLVLRNNALTTLRGIEKMKSLEGLDLSYNIISNFSELEILDGFPSLHNLWLEGNPICCARWFRAQVFSLFSHPEQLKLDNERISASEFWKRQVIVASRQKHPNSFGFYSPAKDDADLEGTINTKRKTFSRLVNIEAEEQTTRISSDKDSVSCDNDLRSKEENTITDEEAEVVELMKRIEITKRERSAQWLQEFKEWMDQTSENAASRNKPRKKIFGKNKEIRSVSEKNYEDICDMSTRYISDSIQLSGDESSTFVLESETSFADTSTVISAQRFSDRFSWGNADGSRTVSKNFTTEEGLRFVNDEGTNSRALGIGDIENIKNLISPSSVSGDINGSRSSPGSPPHYKEDLLHRRQNLEEEIMQLSAESFSVASCESSTSCSEDNCSEDNSVDNNHDDNYSSPKQNGAQMSSICAEGNVSTTESEHLDVSAHALQDHGFSVIDNTNGESDWLDDQKQKRKPRRRMISLPEEEIGSNGDTDSSKKSSDHLEMCRSDTEYDIPVHA